MEKNNQYDYIFQNGSAVLPTGIEKVDIGIKDGHIKEIGNLSDCSTDCCADSVIDLSLIHI